MSVNSFALRDTLALQRQMQCLDWVAEAVRLREHRFGTTT